MKYRLIALVLLGALSASAQSKSSGSKTWTTPRTPEGKPDLQGYWSHATITPLERPANLAGKEFYSEQEAVALERQAVANAVDRPPRPGDPGTYNQFWWERSTRVLDSRRTSLIFDPPDGRIPPFTAEAQQRQAALAAARRGRGPSDGPEDRLLQERCILWPTAGPPMLPSTYNNNYQIIQGSGYVVILVEMIHDARVIPTDGSPHPPAGVRQWMGDSRGRWEGDTLVVDTANFTDKTRFRGSGENLHLVERFTRISPDVIQYEFTVDDPSTFTKPWKADLPMRRIEGPIFEYACNEGNYGMEGILAGARAAEKAAPGGSK